MNNRPLLIAILLIGLFSMALPQVWAKTNTVKNKNKKTVLTFRCDGAHGSQSVWNGNGDAATIFCIHDLSLCSQAYKKFALGLRSKARQTAVNAVDIRDLGVHQSPHGMREWLDMRVSSRQLTEILSKYRSQTKGPIYLMGEGLGASLALDIVLKNAAVSPKIANPNAPNTQNAPKTNLVDGLILANLPASFYKQHSAILKSGLGYVFRPNKRVAVGAGDQKLAQNQEFMPNESLSLVHFVDDVAARALKSKKLEIPLLYLQGNDPYGELPFSLAVFKRLGPDGEFVLAPGGHLIVEVAPDADLIDTVYLWMEGRRPELVVLEPPDRRKASVQKALGQ